MRVRRDEIKPGDHIYFWGVLFIYAHHGIYVGENKVIHFNSDQRKATCGSSGSNSSSGPPNPSSSSACEFSQHDISGQSCDSGSCLCANNYYCGFHQAESGVTISCLNCFIGSRSLYCYQYGVTKWVHFAKFRGGTCTTAPSDSPQEVINRARYLLRDQKGFGNYHLFNNNCEDFAMYCKTGLLVCGRRGYTSGSGQVNFIRSGPWMPMLSPLLPVPLVISGAPAFILIPAFACGVAQCTFGSLVVVRKLRLDADLGVRNDAFKVPVEYVRCIKSLQGC